MTGTELVLSALVTGATVLTAAGNGNNQYAHDKPRVGLVRQPFTSSDVLVRRALSTSQFSPFARDFLKNVHVNRGDASTDPVYQANPGFAGYMGDPARSWPNVSRDFEEVAGSDWAVTATQHELIHYLAAAAPAYASDASSNFATLTALLDEYPTFRDQLHDQFGRSLAGDPGHQFTSIVATKDWRLLPPKLRDYFSFAMDPTYHGHAHVTEAGAQGNNQYEQDHGEPGQLVYRGETKAHAGLVPPDVLHVTTDRAMAQEYAQGSASTVSMYRVLKAAKLYHLNAEVMGIKQPRLISPENDRVGTTSDADHALLRTHGYHGVTDGLSSAIWEPKVIRYVKPKLTEGSGVDAYAPGHEFHGNQYVTVESAHGWEATTGKIHTHTFPGGFFKDPLGKEWYVKAGADLDHLKTEHFANKLYHLAGVKVPDVKFVDHQGSVKLAVAKVPGAAVAAHAATLAPHPDVRGGFAADAWLGNWDAVGTKLSNMLHHSDGSATSITRIDHAASLHRRAQGQTKPFEATLPPELKSLREHSAGPVYAEVTHADIAHGVHRIAGILSGEIYKAALASGFSEKRAAELTKTLVARKDALVAHVDETADLIDHAKGGKSSSHDGLEQHIHHGTAPHALVEMPALHVTAHVHHAETGAMQKTGHDHLGPGGWSSANASGLTGGSDSHQHLPSGEVAGSNALNGGAGNVAAHPHALTDFNAGLFAHVEQAKLKAHGIGQVAMSHHDAHDLEHTHSDEPPHHVNSGPSTMPHVHNPTTGATHTFTTAEQKHLADEKLTPYDKMQGTSKYGGSPSANPSTPPIHAGFVDYEHNAGIQGAASPTHEWSTLSSAWHQKSGGAHGLGNYTGGGYNHFNAYFRNGGTYDKAPSGAKSIITAIKQGDGLPYDAVLYRGAGAGKTLAAVSKLKPGDVFTELAFGSTSLTANIPIHGIGHAGSNGLLFRLKVPKGYPVGYGSHGELEVILMPHTKIQIDAIHHDGDGYKNQGVKVVVEGTVVPHTMAEYLNPANKANQGMMGIRLWKTYPKCPACKVTHKDMVKHMFTAHNAAAEHKVATGTPKAHVKFTQAQLDAVLLQHFKSQGVTPHEHDGHPQHVHDPATGKVWAVGHGAPPKNTWQVPDGSSVAATSPYKKGNFLHHGATIEHEHNGLPLHKHGSSYAMHSSVMDAKTGLTTTHHHLPNGQMQEGKK